MSPRPRENLGENHNLPYNSSRRGCGCVRLDNCVFCPILFEQKITLNGGLLINYKIKIESKYKLILYFKELLKEEERKYCKKKSFKYFVSRYLRPYTRGASLFWVEEKIKER